MSSANGSEVGICAICALLFDSCTYMSVLNVCAVDDDRVM